MTSNIAELARNLNFECTCYFLTHFAFTLPLNLGGRILLTLSVIKKRNPKEMFTVNFRVQSLHGMLIVGTNLAELLWYIPFPQSLLTCSLLCVMTPFRSVRSSISPLEMTLTFPSSFILLATEDINMQTNEWGRAPQSKI